MKRRTKGKEAEINEKLPFVRELVRKGQRAMKGGDSDMALACYSAAQEQIPQLFSIGMKAARIARSKYRLGFAQKLADKVSSESYLCDYWNQKAHKLSIECMIRRMTPWLDYGLAPRMIFMMGGEGGYVNLFELVKNPAIPPRKQMSAKTQQVLDRIGKNLHVLFSLNTSTIFPEGELDFPVCWMSRYETSMYEGLSIVRSYLAPEPKFRKLFHNLCIDKEYKGVVARFFRDIDETFDESRFNFVQHGPVWDWPSKFMKIWSDHPEPWMIEHNEMLKELKATYPEELVK